MDKISICQSSSDKTGGGGGGASVYTFVTIIYNAQITSLNKSKSIQLRVPR